MADFAVEFTEVGQRRRPHPDDQVLVDVAIVTGVGAQLVNLLVIPVRGVREASPSCRNIKYSYNSYNQER